MLLPRSDRLTDEEKAAFFVPDPNTAAAADSSDAGIAAPANPANPANPVNPAAPQAPVAPTTAPPMTYRAADAYLRAR